MRSDVKGISSVIYTHTDTHKHTHRDTHTHLVEIIYRLLTPPLCLRL